MRWWLGQYVSATYGSPKTPVWPFQFAIQTASGLVGGIAGERDQVADRRGGAAVDAGDVAARVQLRHPAATNACTAFVHAGLVHL